MISAHLLDGGVDRLSMGLSQLRYASCKCFRPVGPRSNDPADLPAFIPVSCSDERFKRGTKNGLLIRVAIRSKFADRMGAL